MGSYELTAQGVGRLKKKEREREIEAEKQVGGLKEEGTSDAVFTHKKFNDNEIVALQMAALAEEKEKEKAGLKYTLDSSTKDKSKRREVPVSPRKAVSPRKSSPNSSSPASPRDEEKKVEVSVVGGWTHK